jgi:serine/threonine protein phosphatase PrpC
MGAEVAACPDRVWLRTDMEAPEQLALPMGQACAFALGYVAGDNQDSLTIAGFGEGRALLAVADGAGGQASGADASALAIRHLLAEAHDAVSRDQSLGSGIMAGFDAANAAILELGVGAASTLVVAELEGHTVRSYHAGDSAVLVTGQRGRIKHLSIAHSPVGYAQEAGMLTEREALRHAERHLVSNILGTAEMRIEVGPVVSLAARDTLVLGSDGLFDNLRVDEVADCVRKGDLRRATAELARRVRDRMGDPRPGVPGKPDDLGVILYRREPRDTAARA